MSPATDAALAEIVRRGGDGVVLADREGKIVFWNAAAERIFGHSAAEAVGQTLDLIIPERFRARHWTGFDQTMKTGETKYGESLLRVPALYADGSTRSIAFTVCLVEEGGGGIAAVIRDETERWSEEQALRKRVRELEAELATTAAEPGRSPLGDGIP
jgi:PAS domain S-box-containing protein